MSGWLVLRRDAGLASLRDAWGEALTVARGQAIQEWTSPDGRTAMAAWRRNSGEFRYSGLLHRGGVDSGCVAWTGVCLEDQGETSTDAIALLLGPEDPSVRVAALNGAFAAAAADPSSGALSLWTDRHRQYPVYLWRGEGLLAASTDMAGVIPFMGIPRLDLAAIDLFLRAGEFIDGRTPLEGLEVMPSGTVLRAEAGGPPVSRTYWKLRHQGEKDMGFAAAASEVSSRLTAAVRRVESVYPRLITPLSGGLDSRLILGLCRHPEQVPSVTWGVRGCRDLEYAEAFSALVGSPHRSLPFEPDAFVERWKEGVAATGGCFPVRDMFVLPFVPGLAERADVALNGLAGDAMLGGNFLKRLWMTSDDLPALAGQIWRWRVPAEEEELTSALMNEAAGSGAARDAWVRSIAAGGNGRPIERLVDWLFDNRVFRFTNCGTQLFRLSLESYAPFFDRDVVDFLVRVPMEYRVKHRLYLRTLSQACPPAAKIPWQRTAIAPRWGHTAALASLVWHRGMRILGKQLGFVPFPGERVASPADWFRGPWAAPVQALLFGERARARKLVNPQSLRRLWDAHLAGRDLSRALGALVTLELFCQRFLDRLPAAGGGKEA